VDVGAALVADQQATEPVQPSDAAALHYPALATEAGALLGRATADLRRAAAGTASSRGSSSVMSLRLPAGQDAGERDAGGVDEQVVLSVNDGPKLTPL
jgi:hypothetical protein